MDIPFPPQCAARFRPERLLASGGFGVVYLATQLNLDRPVAIKLLKSDIISDAEQVDRFLSEARITAALTHPHIVMIHDHAVEDGVPWIAYEFLKGRSVRAMLEGGPLSPREALLIASQVAAALHCAHANDVLHRDIKPENVLEIDPSVYKVTDFGIAKWTRDGAVRTKTGFLLGTPAYMAPEQIRADPPTPLSDQYALGAMLFELLTGRPPFVDPNPITVLTQHVELDPGPVSALRPGLPKTLDRLVARALAKSPADRFPDCLAFKAALDGLAVGFAESGVRSVQSGIAKRVGIAAAPVGSQATVGAPTGSPATVGAPSGSPATVATPVVPQATAETPAPRATASGVTRRTAAPSRPGATGGARRITSSVTAIPAAPRARRVPLVAAGLAVLFVVAGGAWLARRPATPPASPTASPSALDLSGDITYCERAGTPELLAKALAGILDAVPEGAPESRYRRISMLKLLVARSLPARNAACDAAVDAALDRLEPVGDAELAYWTIAASWRFQRRRGTEADQLYRRATHDSLVALALARHGQPGPGEVALAAQALTDRGHAWRLDADEQTGDLEWRFRAVLLGVLALEFHRWRQQPGATSGELLSLNAFAGALSATYAPQLQRKAALGNWPTSLASWIAASRLAAEHNKSSDAQRALLACGLLDFFRSFLQGNAEGLIRVRGQNDPAIKMLSSLVVLDVPALADPAKQVEVARSAGKPDVRDHHEGVGFERCTLHLQAAGTAAGLIDWISESNRRDPTLESVLAEVHIQALRWRSALLAGTWHRGLANLAHAELAGALDHYAQPPSKLYPQTIAEARDLLDACRR